MSEALGRGGAIGDRHQLSSKNPEATFLFLQWLVEKKQQEKLIAVGEGGVPVRESSWALPLLNEGTLKGLFTAMRASLDVAEASPRCRSSSRSTTR